METPGRRSLIRYSLPFLFNYNRLQPASNSSESSTQPLLENDSERIRQDLQELEDYSLEIKNAELEKQVSVLKPKLQSLQLATDSLLPPPKIKKQEGNEKLQESKSIVATEKKFAEQMSLVMHIIQQNHHELGDCMNELNSNLSKIQSKLSTKIMEEDVHKLQERIAIFERRTIDLSTRVSGLQRPHQYQESQQKSKEYSAEAAVDNLIWIERMVVLLIFIFIMGVLLGMSIGLRRCR